jgi:hypothetical protein
MHNLFYRIRCGRTNDVHRCIIDRQTFYQRVCYTSMTMTWKRVHRRHRRRQHHHRPHRPMKNFSR